jgi:hypothetical protein
MVDQSAELPASEYRREMRPGLRSSSSCMAGIGRSIWRLAADVVEKVGHWEKLFSLGLMKGRFGFDDFSLLPT